MKKLSTIVSTLMLIMSMALVTSCSSDNDFVNEKPVLPEQGTRIVTLKASALMGGESRVAVEGVEGKEDAFRITGWKDGDVVKVLALKNVGNSDEIEFSYDASKEVFTGEVPNSAALSDLKYAYVGGRLEGTPSLNIYGEWEISINTPIAISDPKDCFLFGTVSVDGESISAALSAPYALACVHNNTSRDIEVGQITSNNDFLNGYLSYNAGYSQFVPEGTSRMDVGQPLKYTVPSGQKAYFVIPPCYGMGYIYYGLYDFTNSRGITAPKDDVTQGKVYKVQVYPLGTTGTAKATIGEKQVDVKWVQLWADGPKFAEYNVGVTDGKAESYGAPYGWGSIIGWSSEGDTYNNGDIALTGDNDTATKLWGSEWRMPTKAEFDALIDNCNVVWTVVNGVGGAKITGKGDYAYNSIFLPASGIWTNIDFDERPVTGYYWSSMPSFDMEGDIDYGPQAYCLKFQETYAVVTYYDRHFGFSIRAVLKE